MAGEADMNVVPLMEDGFGVRARRADSTLETKLSEHPVLISERRSISALRRRG
ncbi:unnamed protein product [Ectocarpus sp. 8 AP-2014]